MLLALIGVSTQGVLAQGYPARTIRRWFLLLPAAAPTSRRILAQKLSEQLGQQVVVDNAPGGDDHRQRYSGEERA